MWKKIFFNENYKEISKIFPSANIFSRLMINKLELIGFNTNNNLYQQCKLIKI